MAFSFFLHLLVYSYASHPSWFNRLKEGIWNPFWQEISPPLPLSLRFFLFSFPSFFLSPPLNMKQEAWSPKWWPFWDQEQSLRTSWHWEWKNEKTERNENLWFDLFELLALWYNNCPYYWSQMQTSVIVICKRKHIANPLTITIYFSMLK